MICLRVATKPLICLFGVLLLTGCQDTGGLTLVKVTGQVTAGSEPFANGLVQFVPKEAGKYTGGSGITDENGNFVLKHTSNRMGIEPGEYNVRFTLMKMPDGDELPDQSDTNHPKSALELGAVEWVDPEYSSLRSTKNPTTVESSGGNFEFTIPELKPQAPGKTQAAPKPARRSRREDE